MISFEEARNLVLKNSQRTSVQSVPLKAALGCVLAENIAAPVFLPHWDNSAMDGFALRSQDTKGTGPKKSVFIKICGTVQAGDGREYSLNKNQAVRIMTGARIPRNANTILIKEKAVVKDDVLLISGAIKAGDHIRKKGEEVWKGNKFTLKGKAVNAGIIGFLASLGKSKIKIYAKPKVAVISTGNELASPSKTLRSGQIYDSNSFMVSASLNEMGISSVFLKTIGDKPALIRRFISQALKINDVLIITGGVSAGDYDFCKKILSDLGVRTIFWKVSQKPGKPLFFGRRKKQLVFGLPGNPASVHMCFYEYVWPCLRHKMGFSDPFLPRTMAPAPAPIKRDRFKSLFLKGRLIPTKGKPSIEILPSQASHMISSLSQANGFIVIPPGKRKIKKSDAVLFDKIPSDNGDHNEN